MTSTFAHPTPLLASPLSRHATVARQTTRGMRTFQKYFQTVQAGGNASIPRPDEQLP